MAWLKRSKNPRAKAPLLGQYVVKPNNRFNNSALTRFRQVEPPEEVVDFINDCSRQFCMLGKAQKKTRWFGGSLILF